MLKNIGINYLLLVVFFKNGYFPLATSVGSSCRYGSKEDPAILFLTFYCFIFVCLIFLECGCVCLEGGGLEYAPSLFKGVADFGAGKGG